MLGIMTGMGNSLQAGYSRNYSQGYTVNRGNSSAAGNNTKAKGSEGQVLPAYAGSSAESVKGKAELPIKPVDSKNKTAESDFPMMRKGADPAEMIIRGKIEYLSKEAIEKEKADQGNGSNVNKSEDTESPLETVKDGECQTCKNRKYQDGSDDPGVSYKTPTKISADKAASAVMGHEMEHVTRERAQAEREDRKIVSQNVVMHTAICPECGESYVSGGTTTTVTVAEADPSVDTVQEKKAAENEAE